MKRKNLVNGMVLAFSVVLIRFIDVRVYDLNLFVTLLLTAGLIFVLMKAVDRVKSLDEPVSKHTAAITNTAVVITIFLAFFVLGL